METCQKDNDVIDPDYYYDIKEAPPTKKQKIDHDNEKNAAVHKIEQIINKEFNAEINAKQMELEEILQRISILQGMLDKFRACVVSTFYSSEQQSAQSESGEKPLSSSHLHPSVKRLFFGKAPKEKSEQIKDSNDLSNAKPKESSQQHSDGDDITSSATSEQDGRSGRFKHKCQIIVGNVSRYIPPEKRENNDLSTHKWMVYVRTGKNQLSVEKLINKVFFFLHPSYKPNDLVKVTCVGFTLFLFSCNCKFHSFSYARSLPYFISNPPFHLTRRGWGEFPVRVQLHFHESRNKNVDIIHNLKLDKTFTGLQTLGAETVVELLLFKENLEKFECDSVKQTSNVASFSADAAMPTEGVWTEEHDSNSTTPADNKPEAEDRSERNVDGSWTKKCDDNVIISPDDKHTAEGRYEKKNDQSSSFSANHSVTINDSAQNITSKTNVVGSIQSIAPAKPKNAKNLGASNASYSNVRKFYKCKDQAGNIILIPIESLPGMSTAKLNVVSPTDRKSSNAINGVSLTNLVTNKGSSVKNEELMNHQIYESNLENGYSAVTSKNSNLSALKSKEIQTSFVNSIVHISNCKLENPISILKPSITTKSDLKGITGQTSDVDGVKYQSLLKQQQASKPRTNFKIPLFNSNKSVITECWRTKISEMATMSELVTFMVRQHPIISELEERTLHHYCCKSLKLYFSWPMEKRLSCEWQRARAIIKACKSVLSRRWNANINVADVWSTKQVMMWCRKFAFTPLHQDVASSPKENNCDEDVNLLIHSSLSDPESLLLTLQEEQNQLVDRAVSSCIKEEDVDVVSIDCELKDDRQISDGKEVVEETDEDLLLPSTYPSEFIQQLSSEVGVNVKPVQVCPGIRACVVQDVLFKACQFFADDLIRGAHAATYDQQMDHRTPAEISLTDVVISILNNSSFDFLTQRNIGVDIASKISAGTSSSSS